MKNKINIEGRMIGDNSPAYIIAEIGLNHNKDMVLAKKTIKAAKDSGADAVKFQTFITDRLAVKSSGAYNIFRSLELSRDDFKEISDYSKEVGITFFSTPFCLECVDWLEELKVPCYKIASGDLNYHELIKRAAGTGKPVILSSGMSELTEIKKTIKIIENEGNNKIILMHTISKYPPMYDEVDLQMITDLKNNFKYQIGFSDHSQDNTMSICARVLGAAVFERHFTLDKNLDGPDHAISLMPHELKELRYKLDCVDAGLKRNAVRSDNEIKKGARRGLYAASDISEGQIITREMIDVVRPANTMEPMDLDKLIDRKIKKNLKTGEGFDLTCI